MSFHLEIAIKPNSPFPFSKFHSSVAEEFSKDNTNCLLNPNLQTHVEFIQLQRVDGSLAPLEQIRGASDVISHVFTLDNNGGQLEHLGDDSSEETDEVQAATTWILPSADFHGQWENLVYEKELKLSLLSYAEACLLLSEKGVNQNFLSWNQVVLLHGPPGTGKTSLCRALAHKLTVRIAGKANSNFSYGHLVEINCHSLFSKWFSESGKMVHKMFECIKELAEDHRALVFVLIDEVESLTGARERSSGGDPSDAIRVVNAVLTQIDAIKKFPNVLILTTSNVTGTIDLAFVDRADLKKYIGLPSLEAVKVMLRGSIEELINKNVLNGLLLSDNVCKLAKQITPREEKSFDDLPTSMDNTDKLHVLAERCTGLSGRTVRKLPVLALAKMMEIGAPRNDPRKFDLGLFMENLGQVINTQIADLAKCSV